MGDRDAMRKSEAGKLDLARWARRGVYSFEAWMRQVDLELLRRVGMDSRDLSDCSYSEWYEDGMSAKAAASKAIRANGGELR